ncbi:MAG: AAA family ATPase [Byssovorax sp.]
MDGTVANARLLSLTLERFKSYSEATTIEFSPLTVILGRNNSGKSSIIQALLLLKQTLALPRPEVPLHLEGFVDALNLREITFGRPPAGPDVRGPRLGIRWSSSVDMNTAWEAEGRPDCDTIARYTGSDWFSPSSWVSPRDVVVELGLDYAEQAGQTVLKEVTLAGYAGAVAEEPEVRFVFTRQATGEYVCSFWVEAASKLQVEMDHFLPYLLLERRNVGPRDRQRSWYHAFRLLFAQPLDDIKALLSGFAYLGSMRTLPPTLYRAATVPPNDLGVSGEYAAQMLQARQTDHVHYPLPLQVDANEIQIPDEVRARSLPEAVNDVLGALGVGASLEIDERDVGFRLLFGKASLQHVGRGISYLLPVVELGLLADPLRFKPDLGDVPLTDYWEACPDYTHCALEEPESHLHPKIQTRLAHWFVALAMARRQLLVETHSDHLVRRLRGLAARAKPGSQLEAWLLDNVRVVQVEQEDGRSIIKPMTLTPQGGLENWPADFMDEATDEERSIYDASLDKSAEPAPEALAVEHDPGEEPDVGP